VDFDKVTAPQVLKKFAHIFIDERTVDVELAADLIDDCRFRRPTLEQFEDARSHEIEVEHLALPDIQHNGAILAVRAANAF
jgi:hypothetical protein